MRHLIIALFILSVAACMRPVAAIPPPVEAPPKGTVLTVIFEVRPPSDSLHVYDVIRGEGRLRTDYPATFTEALPGGHLLFTFRSADERVLKQTSLPFPGPNEYEVPSEEGTIERVNLPDEPRTISLRTQDVGGLRWLDVRGSTDEGKVVLQRVDLKAR